jgi:mRNA interferase RelE/StbE
MAYKVELKAGAKDDFESLDGSVKKEASKKIVALSENPLLGKPLGNKHGMNLVGFYKLYFVKKKYRIVYRIVKDQIEIVEIFGIGKRAKEEIYKLVAKRLAQDESSTLP